MSTWAMSRAGRAMRGPSASVAGGELVEDVLDRLGHSLVAVVVLVQEAGGPAAPGEALALAVYHVEHERALVAGLHVGAHGETHCAEAVGEGVHDAEAEAGARALD